MQSAAAEYERRIRPGGVIHVPAETAQGILFTHRVQATRALEMSVEHLARGVELVALDYNRVHTAFETAALVEVQLSEAEAHDVAFHMTDWLEELETLYSVCRAPESCSTKEVSDALIRFLVNAPNHIAAAAKLLTDVGVRDIFGVGAVEIEGNS